MCEMRLANNDKTAMGSWMVCGWSAVQWQSSSILILIKSNEKISGDIVQPELTILRASVWDCHCSGGTCLGSTNFGTLLFGKHRRETDTI